MTGIFDVSASEIGVVLDSLRQPVRTALDSASRLGLRRVEMAARGEVAPTDLSRTGRRHLVHIISGLGLRLSALGGDPGGTRFADPVAVEQKLDHARAVMEMALELRVPVVTTRLGRIDSDAADPDLVVQVLTAMADMADRTGTQVAFETASADPCEMAAVLKRIGSVSLGICYDPASLVIDGMDPVAGMSAVADQILIARARDAVAASGQQPGHETPIGQGQIDFAEYLAMLDQAGYQNAMFIRRTDSNHPERDLADARSMIESLIR